VYGKLYEMKLFKTTARTATLLWIIVFGLAVVFGVITLIDAINQKDDSRIFRRIVFLVIYTVFLITNLRKYLKEVRKGKKDNEGEVSY
jgi:hypothetical protein